MNTGERHLYPHEACGGALKICLAFIMGIISKNINLPVNGYQPLELNLATTDFQNDMIRNCKGRKGFFGPGSTLNPSYLLVRLNQFNETKPVNFIQRMCHQLLHELDIYEKANDRIVY